MAEELSGSALKSKNCAKRLTDEQRLAIPYIYAITGSRVKTAEELGISLPTVDRWLKNTPKEEMERLQEDQRKELIARALEIVYGCMDRVAAKIEEAKFYDLIGAIKILSERLAAWGGIGAKEGADPVTDELQNILQASQEAKKQAAIEEAFKTGDLNKLKPFVKAASEPMSQ